MEKRKAVNTIKILYVTTIGSTMNFFKDFIKELLSMGHTVDIAANGTVKAVPACYKEWGCAVHQISTSRSPLSLDNLKAYKQLKRIVEKGGYDLVHCHTPIAAVITRLACKKLRKKRGMRVFYTAHGFHFYKGAPLKNWVLYYPLEKLCARFTDMLITINSEDYCRAKDKLRAKQIEYVHGVGVDVARFKNTVVDKSQKREELGVPKEAFLILSVGELNANKNHSTVIKALAKLDRTDVYYIIAGIGGLEQQLTCLAKDLGVADRVKLLGYRPDVAELYKASDVFCFPSVREGLGLAAVEAMAAGLPIVAADNRGTREFMSDGENGYVCRCFDADGMAASLNKLIADRKTASSFGEKSAKIAERYDGAEILKIMKALYQ